MNDQTGFQDRGDAARRAAGIDGTAGDAQDVPHAFVLDKPSGGCLLCGLAESYRKHEQTSAKPAGVAPATDRAAVLKEAADELGRMDYDTDSNDYGYDTYRDAWNGGVMDAADLPRRLADETPAAVSAVPGRADGETAGCGCPSEDAPEHMFGGQDCDCIPFTRQRGKPRYCEPGDTVDMISGWEIGPNCPHHRYAVEQPAAGAQQPKEARP